MGSCCAKNESSRAYPTMSFMTSSFMESCPECPDEIEYKNPKSAISGHKFFDPLDIITEEIEDFSI